MLSQISFLVALISLVHSIPLNGTEYVVSRKTSGDIGCKNERGEAVDWFIVYKLPELPSSSNALEKAGLAHLYMDESTNGNWRKSSISFDEDKHAVGDTLQQLYAKDKDAFHIMYNDEAPTGKSSETKGHAKGVAMFDESSGFWMLHSVPKFPAASHYSYPTGGRVFGQTFLCVSFPSGQLGQIAEQMSLYEPLVYSSNLPASFAKQYPTLKTVIDGKSSSVGPMKHETKLRSSGGTTFTSFAKHGKWGGELYADLVAPSLKQSLNVETWQNGRGDIPSSCKGAYKVKNIVTVKAENSVEFKNSKDHSKWAVSTGNHWVCIGGINRQEHQMARGGGTMCMENSEVWNKFSSMVKSVEPCK